MDRERQMREEQFREVQADATYNHHLLQEHMQAEEQIAAEQEALLDSYRSAREGRLKRWRYRMWVGIGMAWRQHSRPWEEGASSPGSAGLGG